MHSAAGVATNPVPGTHAGATPRVAAPHHFFQTKRTTLNANLLYDFGLLSAIRKDGMARPAQQLMCPG
jgi:hypothetical protein